MSENHIDCPIWGTPAEIIKEYRGGLSIDSQRAGGRYAITGWTLVEMKIQVQQLDDADKAHLTSWLIEQRLLGEDCPVITDKTIEDVKQRRDLHIDKRLDRLLRYLSGMESYPGCLLLLREIDPQRAQAWLESKIIESLISQEWLGAQAIWPSGIAALGEINFFLTSLKERGWINFDRLNIPDSSGEFNLTVSGHAHLEELDRRGSDSSQAFVAMWFDPSMEKAWREGIKLGIEDAGYKALRIDRKEHANKIDDEIIAEIRRSRFIIADFTHGCGGARGGVYYEAGFAYGLGLRVIFTCRKDVFEKVHFDTRQYNHIVWETLEELRSKLARRIAAVLGDGPLRTN